MRRSIRLTAAVVLASALALTGCTSLAPTTGPAPDPGSDSGDSSAKGAVALSFAGLDIQVWNTLLDKIGPKVEDAGYEFLSDDPQWDLQTQISDWESWIARGDVKAIMGYPVQSDSMVTVTQQAQQAGVQVLGYASEWEGTSAAVLIDNRTDGINLGEAMGEWVNEKYGADQAVPVALLGYWDTDLGRERSEGIVEGLKKAEANVSVTEHSVISLDDGYKAAQNQLAAVPDTKVWISMGPDPAVGAYQALLDSGVAANDPDVAVGSIDATDEILDIFTEKDSIWRVLFSPRLDDLADEMAALLVASASGEELKTSTLGSERVTADNADTFYVE
ncbi:sugar ABC transporter substrate-binding protein [Microbacterium oleivorans]|uniref:sugar ABC transporter substrate-binding protein n=1 Tax=Microbacterium oleivorans TaxID=273677 RepID=UPI0020413039|nr:substrate-binding domain-containing protein [Microbacterium oleivorans]MCM3695108.1 substrate-binding domain-containing protein [Microbacterium oleivorans]